jgi:NAD(P)-dependent dehydrogenase (short-subunit alcohol dehydrogenase family)
MSLRLNEKTALVFGGGMPVEAVGNGAAIAIRLAEHGAAVVVVDKDVQAAARTQQVIEAAGGRCVIVAADVCVEPQIKEAVQVALGVSGRIDVLVNNVGVVTLGGPEELDVDGWDLAFRINVRSAFLAFKHVLPGMKAAGRGSIVQVSSVASLRWGGTPFCAYTASKAALNALGQSVAMQYAAHGIRSNNILLGLIDTPLVRQQLGTTDPRGIDSLLAARNALCPTGAMGTAWDAADAAVFLASDDSRYINGTDLIVDGGLHNQVLATARAR